MRVDDYQMRYLRRSVSVVVLLVHAGRFPLYAAVSRNTTVQNAFDDLASTIRQSLAPGFLRHAAVAAAAAADHARAVLHLAQCLGLPARRRGPGCWGRVPGRGLHSSSTIQVNLRCFVPQT